MTVDGRVDSETAPDLDNALSKLRALGKALKGAQGSGGDVRLVSVSQPIGVILRTVGMLQMFKMFATNEEAAAEFQPLFLFTIGEVSCLCGKRTNLM